MSEDTSSTQRAHDLTALAAEHMPAGMHGKKVVHFALSAENLEAASEEDHLGGVVYINGHLHTCALSE